MTFSVKTTVHRNPKSDTRESKELIDCIQDANAGAWLGYLRLGALQGWLHSISLDITMSNDGTFPMEVKVSLEILPPLDLGNYSYRQEFSASVPIRSGPLDDWIAVMIDRSLRDYFARVRCSAKANLDRLDKIEKMFK